MSNTKDKLDRVFSIYVRRRDCRGGEGHCISCGRPISFQTCDAGHYIPRAHAATRWHELNCHAQCRECNRYKDGNLAGHTIGLVERYGDGIISELNALKHATAKFSKSDYNELIKKYKL